MPSAPIRLGNEALPQRREWEPWLPLPSTPDGLRPKHQKRILGRQVFWLSAHDGPGQPSHGSNRSGIRIRALADHSGGPATALHRFPFSPPAPAEGTCRVTIGSPEGARTSVYWQKEDWTRLRWEWVAQKEMGTGASRSRRQSPFIVSSHSATGSDMQRGATSVGSNRRRLRRPRRRAAGDHDRSPRRTAVGPHTRGEDSSRAAKPSPAFR